MRGWWCVLVVACQSSPPRLDSIQPARVPGSWASQVELNGDHFDHPEVWLDDQMLQVKAISDERLQVQIPPHPRGQKKLKVRNSKRGTQSAALTLEFGNSRPQVTPLGLQLLEAGTRHQIPIQGQDPDQDPLRWRLEAAPAWVQLQGDQLVMDAPREEVSLEASLVASDSEADTHAPLRIQVRSSITGLALSGAEPLLAPGGKPLLLKVRGAQLSVSVWAAVDGQAVPSRVRDAERLEVDVPPLARGKHLLTLERGEERAELEFEISNSVPVPISPGHLTVNEEQLLSVVLTATDFDKDPLRLAVEGLPPGAWFDESARKLTFRPDFIQGGQSWTLRFLARDAHSVGTSTLTLEVVDTIEPPWPRIVGAESYSDHQRLLLQQLPHPWLDSRRQQAFQARVVVPAGVEKRPLRVYLHGFGGSPHEGGQGEEFRIYPHDPDNAYWWGYSETFPDPPRGAVPDFVARRVMHLVQWVLANYPHADPERVYVYGVSMGGAGAATLGLRYARHFALAEALLGQTVPRNHRPSRLEQLSLLWGAPHLELKGPGKLPVWDEQDLTRWLVEDRWARNQFLFSKHSKDDPTIHFGAAVSPSPYTNIGWLAALQRERVGHYAVWDEGGHGPPDPTLGPHWWDDEWDRIRDKECFLARNLAFPAFTRSRWDQRPGDGPNQTLPWDPESGYAGKVWIPGDTGWNGDPVGAYNRGLRWDATKIVDRWERFELPLRAQAIQTLSPPVQVDVTPRRVQRFLLMPQEVVQWEFGGLSGRASADADGAVTVPQIPLELQWKTLVLQRIKE